MLKRKHLLVMILLLIGICTLSAVSANEYAADIQEISEGGDAVTIDETNVKDMAAPIGEENYDNEEASTNDDIKLGSSEDDSKLTVDETKKPTSLVYSSWYTVTFNDEYTIASDQPGKITIHRVPCTYADVGYDYNYYVFDVDYNILYKSGEIKGTKATGDYIHTIPAKTLLPGTYIIAAINVDDNKVLDAAVLKVSGNIVITANNYYGKYRSGTTMNFRVTDQVTGKPLHDLNIKVVFTNGKQTVTKNYRPNSNGQVSFSPSVGVGTWTVTMSPSVNYIGGSTVKTATIVKSKVSIKAKKVVEYKGFKTTLKAIVKSNGKNVNEGYVLFKINGKSYKAKVKNGVATKKIKLKKVKKYKYTARFLGNKNLYKTKAVKGKAVLKNRAKVKITFKKPVVYMGQVKKIVIKIKSKGKYVKGGTLYIKNKLGVEKVKVKKGKVVLYLTGLTSDHYKGTNGITTYYKKTVISKKYWVKYVPSEHKYKSAKVSYKTTSKYKCPTCGKTSSHNHYSYGYFVKYTYPIIVT